MSKIKEAEVRKQILSILPEHFEMEGSGKVKVRIYEIDKLAEYILNSYYEGYSDGKKAEKKNIAKLLRKL